MLFCCKNSFSPFQNYTPLKRINEYEYGNKFYDHEFTTIKKLDATPAVVSKKDLAEVGFVHQALNDILLEDLWNVNDNTSKVVDENGEPKVMYHGTNWNITPDNAAFGTDLIYSFSPFQNYTPLKPN